MREQMLSKIPDNVDAKAYLAKEKPTQRLVSSLRRRNTRSIVASSKIQCISTKLYKRLYQKIIMVI